MKDLHSHILMGIDDGSKSLEESLEILKKAEQAGITDIVLTPHYIKNSKYDANNQKKKKLLNELSKEARALGINVKLYLGNEVFIDNDIIKLIASKKIAKINNTRYILIELPMSSELNNALEIFF